MVEPKQKTRLWLRLLFGASLALNLLVIGLVAGAAFRFGGPDGMRPPPRSLGAALYRALPDEHRDELRSHSKKKRGGHHEKRARDAQEVATALRTTPFDLNALDAVLSRQVHERTEFQLSLQSKWLDRIGAMSDAERLAYADRFEEIVSRKGKKKKD